MNTSPNIRSEEHANWPDGWYIFNNGKILGPFTATEAFTSAETTSEEGKPLLISRKGFTQWYALRDLAEIFKITEGLGRKVAHEKTAFEQQKEEFAAPLASIAPVSTAPVSSAPESAAPISAAPTSGGFEYGTRIVKKQVGPKSQIPAKFDSIGPTPIDYASPVTMQEPVPISAPRATPVHKTGEKARKIAAAQSEPTKKQLLQEYFFIRGRLRLGKLRNPWATSFFALPLSVGLFWPIWISQVLKEIFYHAANKTAYPKSIVVNSMIPGLHFYAIYRLAGLLCEMEKQNRYKSVNAKLAVVFGLFPPLAMAYLQDAANRHWMLHARHAGVKQQPQSQPMKSEQPQQATQQPPQSPQPPQSQM